MSLYGKSITMNFRAISVGSTKKLYLYRSFFNVEVQFLSSAQLMREILAEARLLSGKWMESLLN